jgi:hypothetical protein
MASFTSSAAGPSNYRIRPAQESDPKDNSYISSDANSVISTNNCFKTLAKKDEFKNEKGNKSTFSFKSNAYAITAGLFTYKLLDIDYSTPRKVIFYCTMPGCNKEIPYNATRAQISSNGILHYKEKHKLIATNLNEEQDPKKIKSKLLNNYIIFIISL